MSDLVLVTGASGFVGSALARHLATKGFSLRLAVRQDSKRDNLEGLEAEIFTADMRDRGAMTEAMAGVRYVFHVAADYRLWARDPEEIVRNNLEGARAVMAAAAAAGIDFSKDLAEKQMVEKLAPRLAGRLAVRIGEESAEKWVGRMVPLASSAIGGALNYTFVRSWGRRVQRHLREKHLAERASYARRDFSPDSAEIA